MKKVLVHVDGSVRTGRAVNYLIELAAHGEAFEVIVLNVQPKPKLWQTRGIATKEILDRLLWLGDCATAHTAEKLEAAGITYKRRIELADNEVEAVARCALEEACDHIALAGEEHGRLVSHLRTLGLGLCRSVAARVVDRADLPVTVVRPLGVERHKSPCRLLAVAISTANTGNLLDSGGPQYRTMLQ